MKKMHRKERIYILAIEAIKLTTINLYKTSHLANEVLNETVIQNQVLLDIYRYISARDQTADRNKDTASDVSLAITQTTQENNKCQSEVWNETLWVSIMKMGLVTFELQYIEKSQTVNDID